VSAPDDPDTKSKALADHGTLHPHPERVADDLFCEHDFFDPRDLVQVKYEMLRRVRADGETVSRAAERFALSRPTYYKAQADFGRTGLTGLLPARKGPRRAHKLSEPVMAFVEELVDETPSLLPAELVGRIRDRFGLTVHRRSVERALARRKKRGAR